MITGPCNVYPVTPHFYIGKFGFTEVYIISYFAPKRRLWACEAVLTSTHNQCFRVKYENNVYPCNSQFYYIKVGV